MTFVKLAVRSVCSGMENLGSGVVLPESADGGGRLVMGPASSYSTHSDGLRFHLSVPVQHSTRVALPGRRKQGGKGRYEEMWVF